MENYSTKTNITSAELAVWHASRKDSIALKPQHYVSAPVDLSQTNGCASQICSLQLGSRAREDLEKIWFP